MKRIIAFLLCLSMLFSMVPVSTFAAEVDETIPVTEAVTEPAETVPAETQTPETTEEATEAPQESTEVTEAVTEVPEEDPDTDPSATEEPESEETVIEFTWIPQGDLPSEEELFAGYVEKTFYGESATYGITAGSRLTGVTKEVYDSMRPQIEEIAAGKRDSAIITASGLNATDLPGTFSDDLFNALLADLPYDMYWFDKTSGMSGSAGFRDGKLYVTLYFCVSPDYSVTGEAETYDLDTAKTGLASAAAANALAVVEKYEDASDYDKLVGYKKEICSMTSYNTNAASSSYDGGYGDPWQLIWVFDGLAATKVVCEGYSKAYQFLCDLSDFDADIVCYNVQGYMGTGGHMWNIVSINGKSYLADITNSDSGMVGASGGLFLVGKSPNSDGSYTFKNQKFTYGDSTIYQWGLEEGSILILDTKNFDPDDLTVPSEPAEPEVPEVPEEPSVMTGEELQEILDSVSGQYVLNSAVEVTSDLVIPEGLFLAVYGDASITVKNGGSLTVSQALGVSNGGTLTVEAGGTLTVESSGSLAIGGGTTATIAGDLINNGSMDISYGTVVITGTYSGSGSVRKDQYATVNGIDSSLIHLYSYAYSEDMLIEQLGSYNNYASTIVYLMCADSNYDGIVDGPLTITQNVVVPEGVQLNLGYFIQNDQFILAEGASLTVNGHMNIMSSVALTIKAGARLINNGYTANFGTLTNNGIFKGTGNFQQSGTFTGNAPLTAEESALDDFLYALAAAELTGDNVFVNDAIILTEDLTIDMDGHLFFESFASLVVPSGVTLTINSPVVFNGAQLVVDGGSIINNGNLSISNAMGSGGKAVINGTVTSYGYLWITDAASMHINGALNLFGNFEVMADISINGTLNVNRSALMNIYGNISGNGVWNNLGIIHFGAYNNVTVGSANYFMGEYNHFDNATLSIELYEKAPIPVGLLPLHLQDLVYIGSDIDCIRAALASESYRTSVIIREDMTLSENLTIGTNASLEIMANVTIAEGITITAYGPITVNNVTSGGIVFPPAALNVDGTLKLYHPSGTLTVLENNTVNVAGTVFNGASVTVHGLLDISGTWDGYFPNAADDGIITGEGAPTPYDVFLRMIQEAAAAGYPAVLTFDLVIPEYTDVSCDLVVAPGVTLTLDGNLAIWGSLTVEEGATVINNAGLSRESTGHITVADGSVTGSGSVYNSCTSAEDYETIQGIPMNKQSLLVMMCTDEEAIRNALPLTEGYKDATLLVRHEVTLTSNLTIPTNTTLRLYREFDGDGNVIPAVFTIPEGITVTNYGTFLVDNHSTLILHGSFRGNRPQVNEGGSIEGNYSGLTIDVETKVQPSFLENGSEFGLWAGAKMSFSPVLFQTLGGDLLDPGAVQVTVSEGAENYAKIVRSGSLITVTANSSLTEYQVISFTFTAENAAPTTVNLHLRPKATSVDVLLDGQSVTGQTVLADLNRGDSGFQLSVNAAPADAVPENGTTASGGSLVTWKSSAPAIATVDDNGYVTFTGDKTGKVKITATANYGVSKSAVMTFNVVALPQELFPSESNPTVLSGGSSATFTATDAEGTVLKNTAVKWFLCNEDGTPLAAHPYASITAAGKLTTKAVADETLVYLMAQVVGDEASALLPEPVCVTLFPALEYVQILLGDTNVTGATLLYDIDRNGLTYQLDWAAGPYAEYFKPVSWASSKPAIASISQDGLITLAGDNVSGSVKFTLTVTGTNGKKHTASFTVKFGTFTQALDLSVTLPDGTVTDDVDDLVICGGETLTFSGSCLPDNVTTNGITWSLDNKTYGSISSKGVLKTKAVTNPTTVTVTAASKDGYTAYDIDVTLMPQSGSLFIWNEYGQFLTKTTYTMQAGDGIQLAASKNPVSWSSSNTSVATVSEDGWLTAVANGTATITATAADGTSTSFTLTVSKLSIGVEISVKNGGGFTVTSGKTLELIGTVDYSDGSSDTKNVVWSMEDIYGNPVPKTVATISSSGKIAAAKGLTSAVNVCVYADAKDGNSYGWEYIEIVPASTVIEIFGPFGAYGQDVDVSNMTQTWVMNEGEEFTLFTKVFPLESMQAVTWTSSSPKIVEVDAQGNVRCLKSGTATITATAADGSGKKTTLKLNVVKRMELLELPETAVVGGGKSLTFTKMEGYAIDTLATNQTLNWFLTYPDGSSVPASVAALTKGVLKTKAVTQPVELVVRAEAADGSGLAAECFVTVCPLTTSVAIVNAPATLYISRSVDLDAICNPSGAAQDVTWKSSSASVATVDADGVVTALKAGTVTITATAADGSGKKATAKITITEAPAVPPAPPVSGNVEIRMVAAQYGPNTADWWANFVTEFEAAYPGVDLVVDVVSWNDIYTVVNHRIVNGQTPDILNIDIFADFQADGLLLPVKDYMSDATYSKFFPEFLNESKINGTVWAVPDLASARALYYNADLLAELGIKVPETWDELLDAAQDIKATCGDSIVPLGIDMTTDDGQATFALYTWNNGGGFLDSTDSWKLNSAQNVETVEFLRDLVFDGLANPDPTVTTRYDLQDMLGAGQVAMTIAPYGIEDWGYAANLAAAPIPSNTGDSVSLAVMDRMMCFDNNYTDAELAAITAFFDFFYEDARYAGWTELEGFLPVTSTGCDVLAARDSSKAVWGEILSNVKFYPFDKADWYDVRMGVIDVMQRALLGGNVSNLLNELQKEISG